MQQIPDRKPQSTLTPIRLAALYYWAARRTISELQTQTNELLELNNAENRAPQAAQGRSAGAKRVLRKMCARGGEFVRTSAFGSSNLLVPTNLLRILGERGFEPPTPWSRLEEAIQNHNLTFIIVVLQSHKPLSFL